MTGIVFRDSGLRHSSKALYCDLWTGNLPDARIVRITRLRDATDLLNSADLIVQALGYHGEVPDIVVSGKLVRSSHSDERLVSDDDGAAVIGGCVYENLSVLRVEPTPRERRDNSAYGSDLYRRLSIRLGRRLSNVG